MYTPPVIISEETFFLGSTNEMKSLNASLSFSYHKLIISHISHSLSWVQIILFGQQLAGRLGSFPLERAVFQRSAVLWSYMLRLP